MLAPPTWTTSILNNQLPISISLIVLILVHLTDTVGGKRNKTSLLSHLTKPLFTALFSQAHYISSSVYGFYVLSAWKLVLTVWRCLAGGWEETAVVTPLQSSEPEPGAAQWSQAHLSPGEPGDVARPHHHPWPLVTSHHHYHHHYTESLIREEGQRSPLHSIFKLPIKGYDVVKWSLKEEISVYFCTIDPFWHPQFRNNIFFLD